MSDTPLPGGSKPGYQNSGAILHGSRVKTIFSKEFREVFRDRRTVLSVVISPLLITPLLFLIVGVIVGTETNKEKQRIYDVGVVGGRSAPALERAIENFESVRSRDITETDAESEISGKRLSAVVILPEDAGKLAASYVPVPIKILMDAGNESSQAAAARLSTGFSKMSEHIVAARLADKHLSTAFATPFDVSESPIKTGGNLASIALATMLPYVLVVSSFGGSIYAAFDQVAGEKERGTLETLLVSPASRREIVLGKFFAVTAVCLISSVLAVVGVMLSFALPGTALALLSKGGLHLSGMAIVVSLAMMLPLAVMFAGVLVAVSTFARNQKEAQTYITPILLLVMIPVLISLFVRADVPKYMSLVPILGTSIIIKQAFSSIYDPTFIILALGSSVVYGALALVFTCALFENEGVLTKA
jgi:sodium transport system permease protein